ncbi:MAG: toll/interleukin-1 receptor domain-containing protein [Pseudomonadota bacterium]|nr:toll/interleukin-1 receptor domain-containing protein [Pseudomonadota bacterium]
MTKRYRVFVSHGYADRWVAAQIARRIQEDCKADAFIDVFDIAKGDEIEHRIFEELPRCDELLALLTPRSAERNWVWVEIGAARALGKRVVAVLYGVTLEDLDREKGSRVFLGSTNIADINEMETYLVELKRRVEETLDD